METRNAAGGTRNGSTDLAAPNLTALYVREHKLTGAVMVNLMTANRTEEFDQLQKSIAAGEYVEGA